ncbi:hypothetical protein G6L37_07500 [Agrobacterium rubi]|nr:hypothetical protein [Agrobacterium rubi]NTF25213.1 hypothetical protein [Agrobacterium rubi]
MCTDELVSADHLTSATNNEPRSKCCGQCAFLPNDPQKVQATEEWADAVEEMRTGWLAFYCVHTKDDQGRNQICAGYWAKYGRKLTAPFFI